MYNIKKISLLCMLAVFSSNALYAADLQRVKDANNKTSSVEANEKAEKAKDDRFLRENFLSVLSGLKRLEEHAKQRAKL